MDALPSIGFVLVGASSWITINGLYSELGLMVDHIPEGWQIGTYIALIIQLANISVLLYSFIPNHYKTTKFIVTTIYTILCISFISMVIMSFTWKTTVKLFGHEHSIFLLITAFGTSLADCMTSMTFWVFVSWFPPKYISILAAGESSSGIIASILIWIQQLGTHNARYSVELYLILLALILPISCIAVSLLLKYKTAINSNDATDSPDIMQQKLINEAGDPVNEDTVSNAQLSYREYYKYLIILGALSGIDNGMIPSIGTYALLPYGNTAYMASTTISSCIAPFAASLPSYFPKEFVNDLMINVTTIGWIVTSFYTLVIALMSPNPWGSSSDSSALAAVIIVSCGVVYSIMLSCCKSCCITLIKKKLVEQTYRTIPKEVSGDVTNKMMENIGKVIQFGSFSVSVLFFLLVQYGGIFHQ